MALLATLVLGSILRLSSAIRYTAREQAQEGILEQRRQLHQKILENKLLQMDETDMEANTTILALLASRPVLQAYRELREDALTQSSPPPNEQPNY